MKKNYLSPTINIVKIANKSILCASPNRLQSGEAGQGSYGNGVNFGSEYSGSDNEDW